MKTGTFGLAAMLLCGLAACLTPRDEVNVANIAGAAQRTIERHDAYVRADGALTEPAREHALGESAAVKGLLAVDKIPRVLLARDLEPVLERHDAYVRADHALLQLEFDTYLATSDSLRAVLRPPD